MSSMQQMQHHIYSLLQQQQWLEVEKCALQYLSAYPQDVNIYYYLAFARTRLNKVAQAQQDLIAILAIAPDHDLAKNMLRQIQEISGVKQDTQAPPRSNIPSSNPVVQQPSQDARKILGNRYEVLSKLGQGGMGTVYKVRDLQLDRTVALKTLIAETDSEAQVNRFIKEAKATAALDHANIVRVHDIGIFEKTPYFTMDLVPGSSLKEFLKFTQIDAQQLVTIMLQVVDAVHYAHGKGIIHRDIKPANIMIDKDLQPKIMDFGLAKVVGSQDNISKTGDVVGTPAYMSPEQARGDKKINRRADVYSLGATLYQAITGRAPFEGVTYINIIQQVWNDEPIHPRTLNPETSIELEAIILKCLEKDPKKRYKSAALLAKDLNNFLEHRPIIAKPPTAWTRLRKLARRHRTVFITTSTILLFIIVGSIFSFLQWRIAEQAKNVAEKAQKTAIHEQQQAEQARHEALAAKQKAEKDAKANAIRLCKIVLVKAEEAYNKGKWRECGVFAGMGLEVIKDIPPEEILAEKRKGKALVQAAMYRYPLMRKIFPEDKEAWMGKTVWHCDHKTLAFFSASNKISRIFIWNIDTNQQMTQLTQPGRINSVEWTTDGKFLLSISSNTICVWDIAKRQIVKTHSGGTFHSWMNSKEIIAALEPLTAVDIFSGKTRVVLPLTQVAKAVVSRNQKYIAVSRQNEKDIDVWSIHSQKKIRTLKNATHREIPVMMGGKSYKLAIDFLSISPNGKYLICYFYEDVITLWNVKSAQKRNLGGHAQRITGVSWSNDSNYVATISQDKTIRVWDTKGQGQIALLRSPSKHAFISAKWSPDDSLIATSSFDTVIRLWNVEQQQQISTFTGHKKIAHGEWSGDGGAFASYSSEKVAIWDIMTPTPFAQIPALEEGTINTIAWKNRSSHISSAVNNNIYITDQSGKQIAKFVGHSDLPVFLAWNPQDDILASSSYDKTVRLWRTGSTTPISTFPHQDKVVAAVWSPDGQILASLASGVHFWDWQRQTKIKTMPQATGIHWSSDGERFTTTTGKEIHVWQRKNWEKIATLHGHKNPVGAGSLWSPNGKMLCSKTSAGKNLHIWDMDNYQKRGELAHEYTRYTMAWRPDSRVIATGGFDKTIYLWDAFSLKKIASLQATSPIYALSWHKDGKILAANTVRSISLWEVDIKKATLGTKISEQSFAVKELVKWYTKIIADVPSSLEKPQPSPFDLHLKIPGRFIEYAIEKQPQKTTVELFEAIVTDSFGFEETEVYTPTGTISIQMPDFGQKK